MDQSSTAGMGDRFEFDAFLSYATNPDGKLARKLELFLESFHKQLASRDRKQLGVQPLNICRDATDFSVKRQLSKELKNSPRPWTLTDEVTDNLSKSRYLIVLCSENAMTSGSWVDQELHWFLKYRSGEYVRIVVTQGRDPMLNDGEFFLPVIRSNNLLNMPWIDLRHGRVQPDDLPAKLRDQDDAKVALAASIQRTPLNGAIYPPWKREQDRREKRRRLLVGGTGLLAIMAIAAGTRTYQLARQRTALNRLRRDFGADIKIDGVKNSLIINNSRLPSLVAAHWQQFIADVETLPLLHQIQLIQLEIDSLKFLQVHNTVRELVLYACRGIRNFSLVNTLQFLELLDLSSCLFGIHQSNGVAWRFEQLHDLRLLNCERLASAELASILKNCPNLKKLAVSAHSIDTNVVGLLSNLKSFKKLTVDGGRGDVELPAQLLQLRSLPFELDLQNWQMESHGPPV